MQTFTTLSSPRSASRWLLLLLFVFGSFVSFSQSIIGPNYIYADISKNPTTGATTTFGAKNATGTPAFSGSLGTYVIGKTNSAADDKLLFQGGQITTEEPKNGTGNPNNPKFQSAQLYYRVFRQNQAGTTAYNFLPLDELSETDNGTTITRVFQNTAAGIDLISSISNSGIYTVDVYLQVSYVTVNAAGNTTSTVTYQDNNPTASGTAQDYQASFEVTGTRNTAEWTGMISDNWFDAANWKNNMLPSATVDAYIPYPGSGATTQYPKIYANGPYQVSNTSTIAYNQSYGAAVTRGLKFGGGNTSAKAIAELVTGNLLIYGDYTGDYNNFIQDANTTVTFAGSVPQSLSMVSGGDFNTVNIAGVGTKTVTGNMNIATALNFGGGTFGGVTVTGTNQLVASNAGNSVTLLTSQQANSTTMAARLNNETNTGYVLGTLRTTVVAVPGTPQDFGGIGLTLNFDPAFGVPGNVTVNRATGQPFTGANPTSGAYSIKRAFAVVPVNPSPANGFRASLAFKYLGVDYMNVGPNNTTLDDAYFYLAYSTNSTSFSGLGYTTRDNNTTVDNNTLTKDVVPIYGSATFTLADERNPLPVSLVAFNAKRTGDVAFITWETAMERNNRGFEVEVSTNGATFRTLGFVASNSPDSNKRLAYSFNDVEANKSGIRYYRLHQIDYSGKDDYSPVRAVSFAASGDVAALSAYPNPFTSDEIKLALQSSEAGQATLHLTDLMGRQISTQTFAAAKGVTEVSIDQASALAAGSYLAQITAPSGEVKTVRIQKR